MVRHVINHPWRLAATLAVLMGLSGALSVVATVRTINQAHNTNVVLCQNLNELRVELYGVVIDAGVSPAIADRLVKLTDCENLP